MSSLRSLLIITLLALVYLPASAQVPQPADVFGFAPGADYKLVHYDQMLDYFHRLDDASDRVKVFEIGKTVLGRPMLLVAISSEANVARLDDYRATAEKLARARVDEGEAEQLAEQGKAVVWIDGGLHATELAGSQMTPQLAYDVATSETREMQHIRDEVILLLMPDMNPDGLEIVADWYERNVGTPYETTRPPWLYHHYIGHDNNRDWFMNNMPESRAVSRAVYDTWYPQIVYNHHQTSPSWARIFIPPFADPVNPNISPGVTTGVNLVGSAMANRFAMKQMPGVISDVTFSMWWDGGMRTVPYFHNMIGILTETAHATPTPRFYDPDSLPSHVSGLPTDGTNIFYPYPWRGGESHLAEAVQYMITGSMAVLRLAADRKDEFLKNIYAMGRSAIEAGEAGRPYAYVVPVDQWDGGEARNLINILQIGGVEIQRAAAPFSVGDTTYAAGSFVIPAAQAFRPYVMDMLEAQHYPDRRTADGDPIVPYDIAGWTLPMQMGVRVDRIDSSFAFDGEDVTGQVAVAAGDVTGDANYGYVLSHDANDATKAVNRLLAAGETVAWAGDAFTAGGTTYPAGSIVIQRNDATDDRVAAMARTLGLDFAGLVSKPVVDLHVLRRPRVALYKSWVANIDEGWTRWLLEDYGFAVDTLHDAQMDPATLAQYDAVVLPDANPERMMRGYAAGTMPAAFTGGLGAAGAYALQQYVDGGGTLVALDGASDFAIEQLGLPVRDVVDGVPSSRFFIPGSLIRTEVDTTHALAYGMQPEVAAAFVRSRAFETIRLSGKGEGGREDVAQAPKPPVEYVARYADDDLLMSGWALGEKRTIGGKGAVVRVRYGDGAVVLFGFRPQFRGQPRGTYKLLFNALQSATLDALPADLGGSR